MLRSHIIQSGKRVPNKKLRWFYARGQNLPGLPALSCDFQFGISGIEFSIKHNVSHLAHDEKILARRTRYLKTKKVSRFYRETSTD
jgi:hypothetical protein